MATISPYFHSATTAASAAPRTVPVLAFGCELTLVGVTRILGRDKIPFYAICNKTDFVRASRWHRDPPVHAENLRPDELPIFLRSLPLERAVLMPCTDDWLRAVSSLPDPLASRFPACIAHADVIQTMVDKRRFAQLLEIIGTPHPETLVVSSRDHLESLDDSCFTTKILKPVSSVEFARKHSVKGYLVSNRAQALALSANIDFPILLQEFIPGPPTANVFVEGFVDRNSRICALLARQRLRMYPPNLGNSTFSTTVPLSHVAEAVKSIEDLIRSVSYRGIFSAEFKYDSRDGHFKILEINARPWWYVEFAARCGMDLCHLAYLDALGLPVKAIRGYQIGRRCVLLCNDLKAYLGTPRESRQSPLSWVRSWAGADGALFARDDLRPAMVSTIASAQSAIRKHLFK